MNGTFTCPACGMTSHHPDDAVNSYCGNCHEFTAGGGMRHWQADASLGPARLLFGVKADSLDDARDQAADVLGDRTALLELREIPPPEERDG